MASILHEVLLKTLGDDVKTIPYRKELNSLTKDPLATILLTQIIHFWYPKKKPFYKYKEPLDEKRDDESDFQYAERTKLYKKGDSWCEELGFSRRMFDRVLQNIAHNKNETSFVFDPNYPLQKYIEYWTTRDRITFYHINDWQTFIEVIADGIMRATKAEESKVPVKCEPHFSKSTERTLEEEQTALLKDHSENCSENCSKETFSKEKVILSQGERQEQGEAIIRTRSKAKPFIPFQSIPCSQETSSVSSEGLKATLVAIIDNWNSREELRKHKDINSKIYKDILVRLHKFYTGSWSFNGSCPPEYAHFKGKKFNRAAFDRAITQFELAATSSAHYPPVGEKKEKLRHVSLYDFLWNDRANLSYFLENVETDAKLLTDKYLKDEDPELTDAIAKEYQRQQLGTKEEIKTRGPFVKAAKRIKKFLETNKTRLMPGRDLSDENIARWLVTAVSEKSRGKKVPAAYLYSDFTYEQVLPIYFQNEAIFKQTNKERTPNYRQVLYDEERTPNYKYVSG